MINKWGKTWTSTARDTVKRQIMLWVLTGHRKLRMKRWICVRWNRLKWVQGNRKQLRVEDEESGDWADDFSKLDKLPDMQDSQAMLKYLVNSMKCIKAQNKWQRGELMKTKSRLDEADDRTKQLQLENDDLYREIQQLRYDVRKQDDCSRRNNLVFHGVSETRTVVEAVTVVREIAAQLNVTLNPSNLDACHALPVRKGPTKLVCKFTSRIVREQLQSELEKAKLATDDLNWPGTKRAVFGTDHLS